MCVIWRTELRTYKSTLVLMISTTTAYFLPEGEKYAVIDDAINPT